MKIEKHNFKNQEKPMIHVIKLTNPNKTKPNERITVIIKIKKKPIKQKHKK
jgi:hypothetical protein